MKFEQAPGPEQREQPASFLSYNSLEELLAEVDRRGFVQGTQKRYSPEEVREQVDGVLKAKRENRPDLAKMILNLITNTNDLRKAVDQLTEAK